MLTIFAVYDHPRDFPEHVVLRQWIVHEWGFHAGPIACLADSIEEARASVPEEYTRLPRQENDDPAVVESWA